MFCISILVFVYEGKESEFLKYENLVLPLLGSYHGKIMYRIRPTKESIVSAEGELPFEVHVLSFPSKQKFEAYLLDSDRKKFENLQKEAIKTTFVIKEEIK